MPAPAEKEGARRRPTTGAASAGEEEGSGTTSGGGGVFCDVELCREEVEAEAEEAGSSAKGSKRRAGSSLPPTLCRPARRSAGRFKVRLGLALEWEWEVAAGAGQGEEGPAA